MDNNHIQFISHSKYLTTTTNNTLRTMHSSKSSLRQMEARLAFENRSENSLPRDLLRRVVGQLQIVCASHHGRQITIRSSNRMLTKERKKKKEESQPQSLFFCFFFLLFLFTSFRTIVIRGVRTLNPPMGNRGLPVTNYTEVPTHEI